MKNFLIKMWNFSKRWLFTTSHKDIGTLYLLFSLLMLFVGGAFAELIRTQLSHPGNQFLEPNTYNEMVTLHGLVMIFGAIVPALVGIANWQIPLQIGAPDMALPRLNNWSFWLLPFGFAILLSTLIMPGSAPNFGWTFYAPLSTYYGPPSTDYMIFAIHIFGISSILSSINIITTIINMRQPSMRWKDLPIFCWSWFINSYLLIGIMPVLAGTVTMVLTDRHFNTSFFNPAGGGDPLMFQHLFWFFGHPEVYVMILPAFGVISEVVTTFSRKNLYGKMGMIYALIVIAFLSYIVWAHHMFTTGIPLASQLFFMYASMLIAVPTGVKIFNWTATLYKGAVTFETPMLFAIAFLFLFTIGGCTGVMVALVPSDFQYQDTYFIVAHLHYVLVSGTLFAIFAGVYLWIPKWTGYRYNETVAKWHFWLSAISMNVTFFPMHFLGLAGMPRRIADYALQFSDLNFIASIGAFILGLAQLLFLYNLYYCIFKKGIPVQGQIWEGATGLEWQ
ncbi:MAG: cbb3-type cytochrome c oxidase subunit I [Proteobacteria bacterium]|nr:cbb3-type cytochrome c oxidase subunit I [Pseudomonadota bacterium]